MCQIKSLENRERNYLSGINSSEDKLYNGEGNSPDRRLILDIGSLVHPKDAKNIYCFNEDLAVVKEAKMNHEKTIFK